MKDTCKQAIFKRRFQESQDRVEDLWTTGDQEEIELEFFNKTNLSNSLASPYSPDPGEHVLKRSATEVGKQDFPVKWFKLIPPFLSQG